MILFPHPHNCAGTPTAPRTAGRPAGQTPPPSPPAQLLTPPPGEGRRSGVGGRCRRRRHRRPPPPVPSHACPASTRHCPPPPRPLPAAATATATTAKAGVEGSRHAPAGVRPRPRPPAVGGGRWGLERRAEQSLVRAGVRGGGGVTIRLTQRWTTPRGGERGADASCRALPRRRAGRQWGGGLGRNAKGGAASGCEAPSARAPSRRSAQRNRAKVQSPRTHVVTPRLVYWICSGSSGKECLPLVDGCAAVACVCSSCFSFSECH